MPVETGKLHTQASWWLFNITCTLFFT